MTHMKPGDKITIKRGPYAGTKGKILNRITETDTNIGERRPGWTCDIGNALVLVFEDEIGGKKNDTTRVRG